MVLKQKFCIFDSLCILGICFHMVLGAEIEFSSDGQLSQLKHTLAATRRGATTVGACVGSSVALASWAGSSSVGLDGPSSGSSADDAFSHLAYPTPRIWLLGEQQALGGAGLAGDAQVIAAYARQLLHRHASTCGWGAVLPTSRLAQALATRIHAGTTSAGRRAFATDLLVAGVTNKGEAVLFHVTPLGQVYGGKAFAVGAGAELANERLTALLRPATAKTVDEEKASSAFAEAGPEEGCRYDNQDQEEALATALEALLAAHLSSNAARSALNGKAKTSEDVPDLDTGSQEKSSVSAAPASTTSADAQLSSAGGSAEGQSSSARSETVNDQDDSDEGVVTNAQCTQEVVDTLRSMLVAAETGDLHVVCCQRRPPDESSASIESSRRTTSELKVQPHSRVMPRVATATALRKLARARGWWGS